jgi:undecaprenyl-diphosphatase
MKLKRKNWGIKFLEAIGQTSLSSAIVALTVFMILAILVIAKKLDSFDLAFLERLRDFLTVNFLIFAKDFYWLGNAEVSAGVVLISLGILCWRRYWLEAQILAVAALSILLMIDKILKPSINRIRPGPGLVEVDGKSFPSGHSAGNFFLYFYLAYILSVQFPKQRIIIFVIATALLVMMGLSSIYLRVHWLTDILGGYCIGYIWLTLALGMLKMSD